MKKIFLVLLMTVSFLLISCVPKSGDIKISLTDLKMYLGEENLINFNDYLVSNSGLPVNVKLLKGPGEIKNNIYYLPDGIQKGKYTISLEISNAKQKINFEFNIEITDNPNPHLINKKMKLQAQRGYGYDIWNIINPGQYSKEMLSVEIISGEGNISAEGDSKYFSLFFSESGDYFTEFKVNYGKEKTFTFKLEYEVRPFNAEPQYLINKTYKILKGETLRIPLSEIATDSDNDVLSFTVKSERGKIEDKDFVFETNSEDYGNYEVLLGISDGINNIERYLHISFMDKINFPVPQLEDNAYYNYSPESTYTTPENNYNQFKISFINPDKLNFTYQISEMPENAVFDQDENKITWNPGVFQEGNHKIIIKVKVDSYEKDYTFNMEVTNSDYFDINDSLFNPKRVERIGDYFYIIGTKSDEGILKPCIIKKDQYRNTVWEKVMGISESSDGKFTLSHYVIYDSYADNGKIYVIAQCYFTEKSTGYTYIYSVIINSDENGNTDIVYLENNDLRKMTVYQGNIYAVGYVRTTEEIDGFDYTVEEAYIAKYNSNLQKINSHVFPKKEDLKTPTDVFYDIFRMDNGNFVLIGKKSIDNSAHRLWFVITDENLNTLNSKYYNGTLDDKYNSFAPVNSRFGIIETNVGFLAVIENFNYDTQRTSSYLIKLSADLSVNDEKFLYNNEKANINGFLKTSEEKIIGYGRAEGTFLTGSSKDHKSWLIFLESNLQFGDFFSYDKYNPSIYNKREAEIIDFKEGDTFYYGISLGRRLLVLNKNLF